MFGLLVKTPVTCCRLEFFNTLLGAKPALADNLLYKIEPGL